MEDLSARLASKKVFSKLDIHQGYYWYQVPVAKQGVAETALITAFSLFKFLRMPIKLQNSRQSVLRIAWIRI